MKRLLFTGMLLITIMQQSKAHTFVKAGNYNILLMNENQDTANTLAGRWELLPVMPSDTAAGIIPYINFDLQEGRFSGNSGCNNMGGKFSVEKDVLKFGENMISTKEICPGYNERPFLDNLLKTNRYEIKDGVLQLMYNTTILSKWVRHLDTNPTRQI